MNKITERVMCAFELGGEIIINTADGRKLTAAPVITEEEQSTLFDYSTDGIKCVVRAEYSSGSVVFKLDVESGTALAADALEMNVNIEWARSTLINYHDCMWWMIGGFPKNNAELEGFKSGIQGYLFDCGDGLHLSVVNLCGDEFRAEGIGGRLLIRTGMDTLTSLHGNMLTAACSTVAVNALSANFRAARERGEFAYPLRDEREYPAMFEKFGWCSWNAFYQKVSADGLYAKLDEFKAKGIPVHWIIIDDGWSTVKDNMLVAFEADPVKFPEGLKGCIEKIKRDYGVEQVGVWHAFDGYWNGVHPESPLAVRFADSLMKTRNGWIVPCDDPDRAEIFWDAWHGYLADCGVDFVKVDNQSSSQNYLCGTVSTTSGARHAHEALERSIMRHFGGKMIDCMGMDMENVLQRPYSAVSRNSDDFFPDRENGFAKHICQNVYSAIWHGQIYYCDFDMWWSGKSAPVQSGVLRAISGGPVYISDAMGDSELSNILPVCGADGDICRQTSSALPTEDCVYTDCLKEKRLLKIWNEGDGGLALGVFNISDVEITESFDFDVIPVMDHGCEYVAYEYFGGKYSRVNFSDACEITLAPGEVAAFSLYPVKLDGEDDGNAELYAEIGDSTRYFGNTSRELKRIMLSELGL